MPGGAPFFLSVHYTAPHWPWETRDDAAVAAEVKDNLFHLHGGNIHTYRRMIEQMDEGIGRIVAALEAAGVARDTLLVFTSDNGGERFSDSWPLVGGKMDLTEGGIRVPWIAHWPARIAPGGTSGQACMTMDWSATMLAAAGVAADPAYPLDGVSLLPVLDDPAPPLPAAAALAHEPSRPARPARRRLEVPAGRRSRLPVRPLGRRARARQPRQARAGATGGDARRLGSLERDHAADPRRRHREPRLRRGRHAAALAVPPGRSAAGCYDRRLTCRHVTSSIRAMTAAEEPRVDAAPVRRFRDPNYRPQAATLGALRERIDALDAQIVALLAERALCVRDATRFKRDAFQVAAPERQAAVFARVRALAADRAAEFPGLPDVVEAAYRVLVAGFIAGEERFFAETEPIPT